MKEAEWEREWARRIEENAERVRKGEFGKITKEWLDFDGWLDGVRVPHFKIENGDILKADESGIWKESESGGWVNLLVFNSSKLKKLRLLEGSDSPNPGTGKQLGRFTFKKKGDRYGTRNRKVSGK